MTNNRQRLGQLKQLIHLRNLRVERQQTLVAGCRRELTTCEQNRLEAEQRVQAQQKHLVEFRLKLLASAGAGVQAGELCRHDSHTGLLEERVAFAQGALREAERKVEQARAKLAEAQALLERMRARVKALEVQQERGKQVQKERLLLAEEQAADDLVVGRRAVR